MYTQHGLGLAYLALVAVHENRVISRIKQQLKDSVDGSVCVANCKIFVSLDMNSVVSDSVLLQETLMGGCVCLLDQRAVPSWSA